MLERHKGEVHLYPALLRDSKLTLKHEIIAMYLLLEGTSMDLNEKHICLQIVIKATNKPDGL